MTQKRPVAPVVSPYQEAMVISELIAGGDGISTVTSAFRIRGELDTERVRRAVTEVVACHPVWRMTFRMGRAGVEARITDIPPSVRVVETTWSGPTDEEMTQAAQHLLTHRHLSLHDGPGLDFVVLTSGDDHVLAFTALHVLVDEASVRLFWRELSDRLRDPDGAARRYGEFRHQRFALETRRYLNNRRARDDLATMGLAADLDWTAVLTPFGAGGRDHLCGSVTLPLSPRASRLREYATARRTFVSAVATAAVQLALGDILDTDTVATALPVSLRSTDDDDAAHGLYLNSLPVVLTDLRSTGLADQIDRLAQTMPDLLQARRLPVTVVADALRSRGIPIRASLLPTVVTVRHAMPGPSVRDGDVRPLPVVPPTTLSDLAIIFLLDEDAIRMEVRFRTGLITTADAMRIATAIDQTLGAAVGSTAPR